jgi:hypothetical protein
MINKISDKEAGNIQANSIRLTIQYESRTLDNHVRLAEESAKRLDAMKAELAGIEARLAAMGE